MMFKKIFLILFVFFTTISLSEASMRGQNSTVRSIKEWDLEAHDLAINSNVNPEVYMAINSEGKVLKWTEDSIPSVILDNEYEPDTLYTATKDDKMFVMAYYRKQNEIHVYSDYDSITHVFSIPSSFIVTSVGYYDSPRTRNTICALNGTDGSDAFWIVGAINFSQDQILWNRWDYGYIGKPFFVESDNKTIAFTVGIWSGDDQKIENAWDYTNDLTNWSGLKSMIGNMKQNVHITSITGSKGGKEIEVGEQYSVVVTTPKGAYLIVPDGKEGFPKRADNFARIENTIYAKVSSAKSTRSSNNSMNFFHLINGRIYTSYSKPKDLIYIDTGKLMQDGNILNNIRCFGVSAPFGDDLISFSKSILYSDGKKTVLGEYSIINE